MTESHYPNYDLRISFLESCTLYPSKQSFGKTFYLNIENSRLNLLLSDMKLYCYSEVDSVYKAVIKFSISVFHIVYSLYGIMVVLLSLSQLSNFLISKLENNKHIFS